MNIGLEFIIGFLTLFVTILLQGMSTANKFGRLEQQVLELGKKQDFIERIDLSGYRPGMYIISVEIGEMLVNKKVLVQ